jgi:hypothetical protein
MGGNNSQAGCNVTTENNEINDLHLICTLFNSRSKLFGVYCTLRFPSFRASIATTEHIRLPLLSRGVVS